MAYSCFNPSAPLVDLTKSAHNDVNKIREIEGNIEMESIRKHRTVFIFPEDPIKAFKRSLTNINL
jgi:hypothetical protein